MNGVFVNHTNHPSAQWSEEQKNAARSFGELVDVPFPAVSSSASREQVLKLVDEQLSAILKLSPSAVLCQGEYTFAMVEQLKRREIPAMAACSERVVEEFIAEDGSTQRLSNFRFVRFRLY